MVTWMPACVQAGFDIGLMVNEKADDAQVLEKRVPEELRESVRVINSFDVTGKPDSRSLERWKTWAYVKKLAQSEFEDGHLFSGRRHKWFIQLDDDTLPDCALIAEFASARHTDAPMYLGPESGTYVGGQLILMNNAAFKPMSAAMGAQPLRKMGQKHECNPPYKEHNHETDCCALSPMVFADVFLGSCATKGGVQITGDEEFHTLFSHPFKDPEKLRRAWRVNFDAGPNVRKWIPSPSGPVLNSKWIKQIGGRIADAFPEDDVPKPQGDLVKDVEDEETDDFLT
eukprot:CAMPEP_0172674396 /NCGR_PEP_ID=MMETSP1074-20121228/12711_1 /TAXON_ID=2916 /ORGANISM="Ceratium fusus, Strain PA161109" /LENGTH=284 /DNA_ID=CAMNT_0013491799 /DNA_START=325 /DNA_END=1179 /DNA_ORIENTATION=-